MLALALVPARRAWATPASADDATAVAACHRYPADQPFKWRLRGSIDLPELLDAMAPMVCQPIIASANLRPPKVTILAPATLTAPEAYRLFLSALQSMGLTIVAEGKQLEIVESRAARQTAIPTFSGPVPAQDQFVTQLLRLEAVTPDTLKPLLDRLRSRDGDIVSYSPGNTLVITDVASNVRRMDEIVHQLDVPLGGQRIFVIGLRHEAAGDMAGMLQTIFDVQSGARSRRAGPARRRTPLETLGPDLAVSQVIADERQNVLVIVATENAYRRMLALVERLDGADGELAGANLVHVLPMANAEAQSVAGTLAAIGANAVRASASPTGARRGPPANAKSPPLSPFEGEVRVVADKPTNSLIVLASERDFLTLRAVVERLDVPRRQVFIEAEILEVSVDKSRSLGLAWHGGSTLGATGQQSLLFGGSEPSSTVNSLLFSPAALTGLAAGLRGPSIPGASTILGLPPGTSLPSFGVFLQLLQNDGDVNVVSIPSILTTDNEKATLQVGQNLPFPGSLGGFPSGVSGATFGLGTSVQRQDVALELEITPHVNDSEYVRLELNSELSDVANPNYNGLGPATSKRTVKSVVTVRDQQSIVIGGLFKDSTGSTVEKVPLLGDIPILGYLFKSTQKAITKQNLLVVLTPYIVDDPWNLRRVFERKLNERREFIARYTSFHDDNDYDAQVDYRRKRGLLEEINRTAIEATQEAAALRAAASRLAHHTDGAVEPDSPAPQRAWKQPGTS